MKRRSFFAGIAALATGAIAAPALVSASEAKAKFPTGGGFTAEEIKLIEDTWFRRQAEKQNPHAHTLTTAEFPSHSHAIDPPIYSQLPAYGSFDGGRTHVFLDESGFRVV